MAVGVAKKRGHAGNIKLSRRSLCPRIDSERAEMRIVEYSQDTAVASLTLIAHPGLTLSRCVYEVLMSLGVLGQCVSYCMRHLHVCDYSYLKGEWPHQSRDPSRTLTWK